MTADGAPMAQVPAVEALGLEALAQIVRAKILEQRCGGSPEMMAADDIGIEHASSERPQKAAAIELGQIANDRIADRRWQKQEVGCAGFSAVFGEQLDRTELLDPGLELF